MKWDLVNTSNLYLMAIALDRRIQCLRDLQKAHIPMLQKIRSEACRVVQEKWGLQADELRLYVHYQPSYCKASIFLFRQTVVFPYYSTDHFHVHIVNANYVSLLGMTVGQAHLLEDIISLVSWNPICFWRCNNPSLARVEP